MKQLLKVELVLMVLASCSWSISIAQENSPSPYLLPGPDRTLVMVRAMMNDANSMEEFPDFLAVGERVEIHRADGTATRFKKVGIVTFPANAAELDKRLAGGYRASVLDYLKVGEVQEAYRVVASHGPDTLGLNLLSPEVLEAFGLAFIDHDRDPKVSSTYRLDYFSAAGEQIGQYTAEVAGGLPQYADKFNMQKNRVTDSTVSVVWTSPASIPSDHPLLANIYKKEGLNGTFTPVGKALLTSSDSTDNSIVVFNEDVKPGTHLAYYIQVEDVVGNIGIPSDTLFALAVDPSRFSGIQNLQVNDTTLGLWLSWEPLPKQAVYSGIQILKSRQLGSDFVVLDTIPVTDTAYLDHRVIGSTTYYYKVRPLLVNLPGSQPMLFAEASGTLQRFDGPPPAAPVSVRAQATEQGISVSWQQNDELDLFGYYVLRGTSRADLEVITLPVQDTVFLDTTFAPGYSGQLHYAVQAITLNQAVGDTSALASVAVRQATVLMPPGGVQARRTVDGVALEWENVLLRDDKVEGFAVYRQSGDGDFELLNGELLTLPFFTDSTAKGDTSYEYAVTSVDTRGNQSVFSPTAPIASDVTTILAPPQQFYLRNLSGGVEVAWPLLADGAGKQYVIYRKSSGQDAYAKIGTVSADGVFLDKDVQAGVLYEYAIAVHSGNHEGAKGFPMSIRRR